MKIMILLIVSLFSLQCFAQDSVYLNQGDKSPYSGYLLPEDTVRTLRNNTLERDMYKNLSDSKDHVIDLYKQEIDLKTSQVGILSNQNDQLSSKIKEASSMSTWEKIAYFAAGVVITGLAIDVAHQIYH